MAINRRGKFLWFELNRELTLVAHLGMSGQLLVQPTLATKQPHLRARLGLSNGIGLRKIRNEIRFIDQRTFGWLSVEQQSDGVPTCVSHIALDPFAKEFDIKQVVSKIKQKKTAIKPALLAQTVVSGIGNIYADEGLWRARIHPEIICEDLSEGRLKSYYKHGIGYEKSN